MVDINKILKALKEILKSNGYDLVSLYYEKENDENFLRLVVDRSTPIGMDDIVEICHIVSDKLDEFSDEFNEPYNLDISSLGAEKEVDVAKLEDYLNAHLEITLINPIKNELIYIGDLIKVDEKTITLFFFQKGVKKNLLVERNNIKKAKIVVKI